MRSAPGDVAATRRYGTVASFVLLAVATITGCTEAGPAAGCTEIGATGGITVTVLPPLPTDRNTTLTVCAANDDCTEHSMTLRPGMDTIDLGCRGTAPDSPCSAGTTPDGTLRGFATVPDLSADEVVVTLELTTSGGATTSHGPTRLTPEQFQPNGEGCPPIVYQAHLTVTGPR